MALSQKEATFGNPVGAPSFHPPVLGVCVVLLRLNFGGLKIPKGTTTFCYSVGMTRRVWVDLWCGF